MQCVFLFSFLKSWVISACELWGNHLFASKMIVSCLCVEDNTSFSRNFHWDFIINLLIILRITIARMIVLFFIEEAYRLKSWFCTCNEVGQESLAILNKMKKLILRLCSNCIIAKTFLMKGDRSLFLWKFSWHHECMQARYLVRAHVSRHLVS